ncbi:uncharacterized protein [Lepisosteus oculatus]|uniref:uncharacterized protein isoform X1 n=2 Tax=Lepisosteus oculatus TaxID=7918 RepID=UPI0007401927|nr:PREDICTED: uncharacterized protein LOC107080074 isoform X1 [Lepisosteus oculatus]XP_015224194.1 PREDICTED: uncharacterized protein LOC107080074 isoform X1 [Lepisosteus oculatus]
MRRRVFLSLCLLQGALCTINVTQYPRFVMAEVGKNVTMNCKFSYTNETVSRPILYWYINEDEYIFPHTAEQYKNRVVQAGDGTPHNKSVQLQQVQLEDTNTYYCMMSYIMNNTSPVRTRSRLGVQLFVHGPLNFFMMSENNSELCCEIRVPSVDNVRLSLLQNGTEVQTYFNATRNGTEFVLSTRFQVVSQETLMFECRLKYRDCFHTTQILRQKPQRLEPQHPLILYTFILLFPFCTLLLILSIFLARSKYQTLC